MPTFHRVIFWAHLLAGLVAGTVILSMAVSGLLISFETQLVDWANRDLRVTPPSPAAPHLDPAALLERVHAEKPDFHPSGLTWKSDPTAPATLSMGRDSSFFVDPYTGADLGEGNSAWHDFFHAVTDWHRFLTGTGLEREAGKAITGAGCLVFGLLLVSGIYLWFPRQWRWIHFRAVTLFNPRLKGRARDWNWHNVLGFWSCLPMLLIILTGLVMSYTWANNLLYTATGNAPPPPRTRSPGPPASGAGGARGSMPGRPTSEAAPGSERRLGGPAPAPADFSGLASLITQVRADTPGWTSLSLRTPAQPGQPFSIMIDRGGRGEVHRRTMLHLDPLAQTFQTSPDDLSQQNLGRRLRMYARYLHTGELFGLPGQIAAALCTLAAATLVWTGFALAWRRFFRTRKAVT